MPYHIKSKWGTRAFALAWLGASLFGIYSSLTPGARVGRIHSRPMTTVDRVTYCTVLSCFAVLGVYMVVAGFTITRTLAKRTYRLGEGNEKGQARLHGVGRVQMELTLACDNLPDDGEVECRASVDYAGLIGESSVLTESPGCSEGWTCDIGRDGEWSGVIRWEATLRNIEAARLKCEITGGKQRRAVLENAELPRA